MALDEPDKDELPVKVNGIDVLVTEPIQPYVKGTVIDYVKRSDAEGFVLRGGNGNC